MIGGLPSGVLEKALKNIIAQRCMMKPDADYKKKCDDNDDSDDTCTQLQTALIEGQTDDLCIKQVVIHTTAASVLYALDLIGINECIKSKRNGNFD